MLPPEWWPQCAVMLTWPHARGDWADGLAGVEKVFIELASVISQRQTVLVSAYDEAHKQEIAQKLEQAGAMQTRLQIHTAASNDIWVRDHGPLTIIEDQELRLLDFQFNGWGGKYAAELDNSLNTTLHAKGAFGQTDLLTLAPVIEGGGIEVNGEGCLLTTRNCLTLPTRNPGMDEATAERLFDDYFGCKTTHWLSHGQLLGDDTDGHIDTLARFADADTIVYQGCEDRCDEHYPVLQAMAGELAELRRPDGRGYRLQALPLPTAIYNKQGQRLPAGYANFLIINDAVLMPSYSDPADTLAAEILASCFSGREVISIDCRALIEQYGSLHCATMQLPAGVLPA